MQADTDLQLRRTYQLSSYASNRTLVVKRRVFGTLLVAPVGGLRLAFPILGVLHYYRRYQHDIKLQTVTPSTAVSVLLVRPLMRRSLSTVMTVVLRFLRLLLKKVSVTELAGVSLITYQSF